MLKKMLFPAAGHLATSQPCPQHRPASCLCARQGSDPKSNPWHAPLGSSAPPQGPLPGTPQPPPSAPRSDPPPAPDARRPTTYPSCHGLGFKPHWDSRPFFRPLRRPLPTPHGAVARTPPPERAPSRPLTPGLPCGILLAAIGQAKNGPGQAFPWWGPRRVKGGDPFPGGSRGVPLSRGRPRRRPQLLPPSRRARRRRRLQRRRRRRRRGQWGGAKGAAGRGILPEGGVREGFRDPPAWIPLRTPLGGVAWGVIWRGLLGCPERGCVKGGCPRRGDGPWVVADRGSFGSCGSC